MGIFLYNKLWLVMVISTACVVTSAEPKPTHKSRVVDRVRFTIQSFIVVEMPNNTGVSVVHVVVS